MRGNGAAALGSGRRWRELLKVVGLVIMTPAGQDAGTERTERRPSSRTAVASATLPSEASTLSHHFHSTLHSTSPYSVSG